MTIAVIKTGGKQYKIKENQQLKVEKLAGEVGEKIVFDNVLLVADAEGKNVQIGQPILEVKIEAEIMEQGKARKVSVVKYKAKTRYHKTQGHRQAFTRVKILKIGAGSLSVEKKVVAKKQTVKKVVKKVSEK